MHRIHHYTSPFDGACIDPWFLVGNARKSRVFTGHPSFEIENAGGVRAIFCGLTYQPTNN